MAHPKKKTIKKRELLREELMIKQLLLLWPSALTAAHGMFITLYVVLAVITEVN